jgi:glycosyltransferase involved in cell wall biosynthesis
VNIAFATPVVYPFVKGGAEKRIHEVGRRLARRGHDITVYSRHWWDGPKIHQHAGMTLQAVGPAGELYADGDRRSISSALGLAARLTKPLAESQHNVVSTPVAPYLHAFSTRLSTGLRQTPLVVTWHEVWDDYWYQYMGRLGSIGKTIEWMTAQLPQHAVVPSRTTEKKLHELAPGKTIEIIPNGIDFDTISTTEPAEDGYDILYVGRLIEDKNVGLLIDALEKSGADAQLGIIGDGPTKEQLSIHAARSDVAEQITFLGFLEEYDDVLAQMRAADVFVSPSTREGFGITLLEAMAADCTVITVEHEHSAGSEVVGDAGFVVTPTVDKIANVLKRALDGGRPIASPTERAQNYDWRVITDQVEDFYQSII